MPAAVTRNMAGEHSGRERRTQVGVSGSSSHGWLRRPFWMAAASAVILLLSLGGGQLVQAQTFTTLHSFSGPDGEFPGGSPIRDASGNLYGTTINGGSYDYGFSYAYGGAGNGTVFKIDPSGNETVLYSFIGGADGAYPFAGLVQDAAGNLYGMTTGGGSADLGTVFKVDPSGNEIVLHNFTGGADGASPHAGLVQDAAGNLYGTTRRGGSADLGTVFKVDPSGNEIVLHSFTGGADGAEPYAGLVRDTEGILYGTASGGGTGYGTVFKIDPSGNFTVVHSFDGGTDGAYPCSELVRDASGNLYGTTAGGGTGYGTVFKIDSSGNEAVLYRFTSVDARGTWAGVVRDASGNLYGTLMSGGSQNCFLGCGTVYKIDPSGNYTVLHNFDRTDGAHPIASLMIDASGNLYGTTQGDVWASPVNYGTVFKIDFSVPFSAFSAKLDTTASPPRGFQLQAFFTQGTGTPAIDPVAQGMTLTVGTYTVTIPPGAFHQTKKGWFVYEGTIGGVALEVRISQTSASSYRLQAEASGVDLTSLTNPITVTVALGNNNGTIGVNQ